MFVLGVIRTFLLGWAMWLLGRKHMGVVQMIDAIGISIVGKNGSLVA